MSFLENVNAWMKLCGKEMKKFGTNSDMYTELSTIIMRFVRYFALLSFVRLFVPPYVRSFKRSFAVCRCQQSVN